MVTIPGDRKVAMHLTALNNCIYNTECTRLDELATLHISFANVILIDLSFQIFMNVRMPT